MKACRWVIALLMVVTPIDAVARDPRVPPGRDPGGIAVAIVSAGIDYTQPQIAARLARDGEGEIIGWDFTDGDALPFNASQNGHGTVLASMILAEAPGARLVPVRIDAQQPGSLTRALAFIGQTPAQVVLVADSGSGREDWEGFREAARHFNQLLIIVPADVDAFVEAAAGLDNMLRVDAAAPSSTKAGIAVEPPASQLTPVRAAAARAAARAAETAARTPGLDGPGMKRALLQKHAR